MKSKEGNLTLRQRYEAQRRSTDTPQQSTESVDGLLRKLLGSEVTVKFQSGEEVTAVFTAIDRFAIKLGSDLVVFKGAIQSVRLLSHTRAAAEGEKIGN